MSDARDLVIGCPCGELIGAPDEQGLVVRVNRHLVAVHPEIAGRYTPEDILLMASFWAA
jgi:hypothetical protein